MLRKFLPIIGFILLLIVLAIGLTRNPSLVSSPLIGKPLPRFSLPLLHEPESTITNYDLLGTPHLLNVWASWCYACRIEHPLLMQLSEQMFIPIYGLNYRDERDDALAWLKRYGNPYAAVAFDQAGKVGIDLGVYGAPETYLIDRGGTIVYKHIGPISNRDWETIFHPKIIELQMAKP